MTESGARPAYLQIAGLVRDGIRRGVYPVGTTLPTVAQLASTYEASETAVRAALRELRNDGYVTGHTGGPLQVTGP